jgi:hypothetical protein
MTTKTDYEQQAVDLANLAREMASWPPDAIVYIRPLIREAQLNIARMLDSVEERV